MSRIGFLNTQIDNLTMNEAVENITKLIEDKNNSYVVTPNLDHIVMLESDTEFFQAYKNADLILADGKPLIWISKLLKNPIKEKISGSDLFPQICKMSSKKGFSIFILGAAEGVAEQAAKNLINKYRNLKIAGVYSPPFGFENDNEEINKIIEMVSSLKPDILAVSLGSPKGEKFIYRYKDSMNIPLSISIGATIDFEAGNVKRAPKWMSNAGLEWLYRMMKEPRRLAKRYLNDACKIVPIYFKYKERNIK